MNLRTFLLYDSKKELLNHYEVQELLLSILKSIQYGDKTKKVECK